MKSNPALKAVARARAMEIDQALPGSIVAARAVGAISKETNW